MTRLLRLVGPYYDADGVEVEEAPSRSEYPDPPTPRPGAAAPSYPDGMPAPGAFVADTGPAGEGTASGTLTIQPSYALPLSISFRSSAFRAELGYETVLARGTSSRSGYECTWDALTQAEYETLRDLFRDHASSAAQPVPFNWTPPGKSAGVWALAPGAPPQFRQLRRGKAWEARAVLVECR